MKIFDLDQIHEAINIAIECEELLSAQKSAFMDFSSGLYEVPLPMQFIFPTFGSNCHIKSGYKQGSKNLIIKIANSSEGGNNGIILVFDINTGETKAILHDKGFLTTLRTAITGMIVAELVPWEIQNIGIIGSGSLAAQLYKLARQKYPWANVILCARNKAKAARITDSVCDSVEDLLIECDVILTTTSSASPIIHTIRQETNKVIIALGSDDEHKSEILPSLFEKADMVIVDSKSQAAKFGDVSRALKAGIIAQDALIELGKVLKSGIPKNAKTIITDFSGIGAQDVAMTEFILSRLSVD